MLEPTIPDRSHISRQFCHNCRNCSQICRQFRHLGEIVCKYGLDLRGPAFRGFCRGQGVTRKFIPVPLTILCLVSEFELVSRVALVSNHSPVLMFFNIHYFSWNGNSNYHISFCKSTTDVSLRHQLNNTFLN